MRASGRGCSFLHRGMNTVMSLIPLSQNQFTANWMPWHENTFLSPWLQRQRGQSKKKPNFFFCVFVPVMHTHTHLLYLFQEVDVSQGMFSEFSETLLKNIAKALRWVTGHRLFTCMLSELLFHGQLQNKWRFLTQKEKHDVWQYLSVSFLLMSNLNWS